MKEELSVNQKKFVAEAEMAGLEVNYNYSGRGMFGRQCPSVNVDDLLESIREFSKNTKLSTDQMGMGYVIYAKD